MKPEEYVFLEAFVDLRKNLDRLSPYNIVRSAGIVRTLLLDTTPLVHAVNKHYKSDIKFAYQTLPPFQIQAKNNSILVNPIRFSETISKLKVDVFLSQRLLTVSDTEFSVREIIKFLSIKWGGIHFERIKENTKEKLLLLIDGDLRRDGENLVLRLMYDVALIVLKSLFPLFSKVTDSYRKDRLSQRESLYGHYVSDEKLENGYKFGKGFLRNKVDIKVFDGIVISHVIKLERNDKLGFIYQLGLNESQFPALCLFIKFDTLYATVNVDEKTTQSIDVHNCDRMGLYDRFNVLTVELSNCSNQRFALSVRLNSMVLEKAELSICRDCAFDIQTIGANISGENKAAFTWKEAVLRKGYENDKLRDEIEHSLWINCIL